MYRFCLVVAGMMAGASASGQSFSDWGYESVSENLANPNYPTHVIFLNPDQGGSPDLERLIVRCEDNSTDVYVALDGVYGSRGRMNVRWPGMESAVRLNVNESTRGTAAFIQNEIGFLDRLVQDGSVVLQAQGYSVRGAARFTTNEEFIDALYRLAATCEWDTQLPARVDISPDDNQANIESVRRMLPEIDRIGRETFIQILSDM